MLKSNWGTICTLVEMVAADGKRRKVQAADSKGLLRIIQSIPSPKAEPFKQWLAQVGSDRLDEIENPELATQRTRELYKQKGYPEDWIEKRLRSIAIREELTEEWKNRGVKEKIEYAILTAEISKFCLKTKRKRSNRNINLFIINPMRGIRESRLKGIFLTFNNDNTFAGNCEDTISNDFTGHFGGCFDPCIDHHP